MSVMLFFLSIFGVLTSVFLNTQMQQLQTLNDFFASLCQSCLVIRRRINTLTLLRLLQLEFDLNHDEDEIE